MAADAARKTPATDSATATSKQGLVDPVIYDQIFTEKDRKPVKIKLKRPNVQQSQPGNWQDNKLTDPNKKGEPVADSAGASPIVNPLDDKTMAAFPTGRPLEDKVDVLTCKHCKRPILRHAMPGHIRECLDKKQQKQKKKKEAKEAKEAAARRERGEEEEPNPKGARKSALKGADDEGAKKGKKRKLDGDAEKAPPKKKKKDEPKAKAPKPKGPVDVERQCGVPLPNGGQCARSLTCKSHSMGLKRAVPGRSLPYDMLLAQYQKKNQAKQQRAAIDANAPLVDDLESHGPVDSDEETEAVMAAIVRSHPQPLATRAFVPTRNKYQYVRMKEMLHTALSGSRGASLFTPPGLLGANGDSSSSGGLMNGHGASLGHGGGSVADAAGSAFGDAPTHSRKSSAAMPRPILPGQLPPPTVRKTSITAA